MRPWSIYCAATGVFIGRVYAGPERDLAANTPPGHAAWPGVVDHLRLRVQGGQLVPYLPPRPDDTALQTWRLNDAGAAWQAEPTDLAVAMQARAERDKRMAASDWVSLRAQDTGQPMPPAWQAYRQALRDITAQPGWPRAIEWPVAPDA